ncbi:MAG: PEP-CTERM sorting domain-containing protein [Bryobacteraceae bacterium]
MRTTFLISAVLLLGMSAASQANAGVCGSVTGNIVKNCGFETLGASSIPSWTVTGNTEGGYNGAYWGVDNSNPHSGSYEGYFGVQGGGGSSVGTLGPFLNLSQKLSAVPGMLYQITFYLDQDGPTNAPGYTNYFDAYFNGVQLMSETNAPNSGGYQKFTFTREAGGASPASEVLSFDFQNDDDYFFFDDVSAKPMGFAPEPASLLLIAPALGGLLFLARRRRQSI